MFFVSCGYGPEMLEFREETLDPVASSVGVTVKRRWCGSARDRADNGPGADALEVVTQTVAVIGRIRQQCLSRPERAQHVIGGTTVMGLSGRQFQRDRQASGVGDGVDLRRQTTPRAPHAAGSKLSQIGGFGGLFAPLFAFAPCW